MWFSLASQCNAPAKWTEWLLILIFFYLTVHNDSFFAKRKTIFIFLNVSWAFEPSVLHKSMKYSWNFRYLFFQINYTIDYIPIELVPWWIFQNLWNFMQQFTLADQIFIISIDTVRLMVQRTHTFISILKLYAWPHIEIGLLLAYHHHRHRQHHHHHNHQRHL